MTQKVAGLLKRLKDREYRAERINNELDVTEKTQGQNEFEISSVLLEASLAAEPMSTFEDDRIGFHRLRSGRAFYMRSGQKIYSGGLGNITVNYSRPMEMGMDEILNEIREKQKSTDDKERSFHSAAAMSISSALDCADRLRSNAHISDNRELYDALSQVPHKRARNLLEALVFMKFIIFTLRAGCVSHLTLGRFDQYMYPYYMADKAAGRTDGEILELIEEFFISINFDTDLYIGVQQGDNGQSMVLGGCDSGGGDAWNALSDLCLEASRELCLIDPKINLRVNRDTPFERYLKGTELTRQGLGFPQYCNDDVVIPGLVKLGYDLSDARNYTVAACWEFIVPGCGMDIPNIATMNFPLSVERATKRINECPDFRSFLCAVDDEIVRQCEEITQRANRTVLSPSPYLSVFVDGCIEKGRDISQGGAKYYNYGIHGAGIAVASDAITAVRTAVYEDRLLTPAQLLEALESDFAGHTELRSLLLSQPKMGNNERLPDDIACHIMRVFADTVNTRPNNLGGVFRAGTGSAMEYLWSASKVGATADGRRSGAPYGSSFSPSMNAKLKGVLSVIQSFTKFDMTDIINGGPLTIEIHDTAFRNDDGVEKVAKLVQLFIGLGGHQLQLNSINRERLLDAQRHPEHHPNLIVRVWGWSGYFNELDMDYQNHIIARTEFGI